MQPRQVQRHRPGEVVEGNLLMARTLYEFRGLVHGDDDPSDPGIKVMVHKYRIKTIDPSEPQHKWREWTAGNPVWVYRHWLGCS
ncbi:hypothetical protein GGTG_13062 [Gaeumannomyces tritici R3-111a-1]|uniref:Uncharacterized protein n=1 Tax=Gaeumannomyces tritici (strain R3-111a-1) TaxID=644352 RepID=J3PHT1_GAET3|nr:hypothetical protein GGTG_13062 [Gaeumannomyces tritici R3-111a-1]EJT69443.1 hypothetical protein GGTG_13062 [Gaeumannomyces tritici R3-111a-1]